MKISKYFKNILILVILKILIIFDIFAQPAGVPDIDARMNELAASGITVGQSRDPYDRGVADQATVDLNNENDRLKMIQFYNDDPATGCRRRAEIGQCEKLIGLTIPIAVPGYGMMDIPFCLLYPGGLTKPYYEYYVPFQKIEVTDTPFATGYVTKADIEPLLEISAQVMLNAPEEMNGMFDHIEAASNARNFGIEVAGITSSQEFEDAKQKVREMYGEPVFRDLEKNRLRNPFEQTGRYMEQHVLSTGFNAAYRDANADWWVHVGAKESWYPVEIPVPTWFGEFPDSILQMRTSNLARAYPQIGGLMKSIDQPDNCLEKKYSNSRLELNAVLPGMLPGNTWRSDIDWDTGDNCMPGFYGPIFNSPLNRFNTSIYGPVVGTAASYRALKLALIMGRDAGRSAFLSSYTSNAAIIGSRPTYDFHDFQETLVGDHKPDMFQFLDKRAIKHPGCQPENFFPDTWNKQSMSKGEEWGTIVENKVEQGKGDRYVTAHYRYVRGCPVCYAPAPGTPAPILR